MSSETVMCEQLRGNGTRGGLAFVKKGATEQRITGRLFRDTGRTLKDGTRVFELVKEEPDYGPAQPDLLDLADEDLPGMWSQSDFTGGQDAVWSEKHGRYI